ncbi:MAG TPA: hypothetical protein VFF00_01355 [Candidatus Elarobacter sp.]|nr:hypothetical protein [Dongiaceae bacterium]HZW52644.1 hypothetical protein [Candidatus Elarobacter sp.]
MLLGLRGAGFEHGLAGRDERAGVLHRGVRLVLRRRGVVRALLDDRALQLLRLRHAFLDERLRLLVSFLRRVQGDGLKLPRLLQRPVEERIHTVVFSYGAGSPPWTVRTQRSARAY